MMFDYSFFKLIKKGTLCSIQKTPEAAIPPPETLNALAKLCSDEKNQVYIISGRDRDFLETHLGHIKNLGLRSNNRICFVNSSAEHGCFLKYVNPQDSEDDQEEHEWINLMENADVSWKHEVESIFNYYTDRTPGSFVEHKTYAITWHYRLADFEYG